MDWAFRLLQDETRIISVLRFGATYIRDFTVLIHDEMKLKFIYIDKRALGDYPLAGPIILTHIYDAILSLIARFMGPTRGPSGAKRTQVGPMLAPWTLLSGISQGHNQSAHWVWVNSVMPDETIWHHRIYRQVSNIRRTKFQHLRDSHTVLRLSLLNLLKPDVKSRMKM